MNDFMNWEKFTSKELMKRLNVYKEYLNSPNLKFLIRKEIIVEIKKELSGRINKGL